MVSLTSALQISNLYGTNQSKYSLSHLRQEKQDYYNNFKLEKTPVFYLSCFFMSLTASYNSFLLKP